MGANFNFNKVILGGRLTADPELKTTQSGTSVTSFSVAINRKYTADGQQPQADFINVVAWQQRAEFVSRYFRKGSSICVTGSLQTRSYTDRDGQKRTVTEVVADEVNFVDSKSENGGGQYNGAPTQNRAPQPQYAPHGQTYPPAPAQPQGGYQQTAYIPQSYQQTPLPTSGTGYADAPTPGDDDLPF
ncbi:MAG: single-stranded DNA-binding protein [Clostridia bacterium]|nr:single-stranded DNA-binding protein [Clostridia bacterium]